LRRSERNGQVRLCSRRPRPVARPAERSNGNDGPCPASDIRDRAPPAWPGATRCPVPRFPIAPGEVGAQACPYMVWGYDENGVPRRTVASCRLRPGATAFGHSGNAAQRVVEPHRVNARPPRPLPTRGAGAALGRAPSPIFDARHGASEVPGSFAPAAGRRRRRLARDPALSAMARHCSTGRACWLHRGPPCRRWPPPNRCSRPLPFLAVLRGGPRRPPAITLDLELPMH